MTKYHLGIISDPNEDGDCYVIASQEGDLLQLDWYDSKTGAEVNTSGLDMTPREVDQLNTILSAHKHIIQFPRLAAELAALSAAMCEGDNDSIIYATGRLALARVDAAA